MKRKAVLVLAVALVIGGGWLAQTLAQTREGDAPRRGERGQGGGDRETRMREFRERMETRQREQLGASEEDWKVLKPRIEKIQTLKLQLLEGGIRNMFGRRGGGARRGRTGGDQPANTTQPKKTDLENKTEALQKLLADKNTKPPAIAAALDALRQAKAKLAKDLATAQKELKSVVTRRQEAQLVLMRVLD